MRLRVGQGYDVHRLVPGRPLVLGGEEIPFHARPRRPQRRRRAAARARRRAARRRRARRPRRALPARRRALAGRQQRRPAGAHHRPGARRGLARALLRPHPDRRGAAPRAVPRRASARAWPRLLASSSTAVGLKATTNEGLGALGRGEGMAALAVVLLGDREPSPRPGLGTLELGRPRRIPRARSRREPRPGGAERRMTAARDAWSPASTPCARRCATGPHRVRARARRRRSAAGRGWWRSRSSAGGTACACERVPAATLAALGVAVHNGFAAELRAERAAAAAAGSGGDAGPGRAARGRAGPAQPGRDPARLRGRRGRARAGARPRQRARSRRRRRGPRRAPPSGWRSSASPTARQEIARLKEEGFWVYGAAAGGRAALGRSTSRGKVALCLGGEEKGLRQHTRELCDGAGRAADARACRVAQRGHRGRGAALRGGAPAHGGRRRVASRRGRREASAAGCGPGDRLPLAAGTVASGGGRPLQSAPAASVARLAAPPA